MEEEAKSVRNSSLAIPDINLTITITITRFFDCYKMIIAVW